MKLENIKKTKQTREVISDKLEKLMERKPKDEIDKFNIDRFSTNSQN